MDLVPSLIIILLFLVAEGFFSGAEIAIVSADQFKLRHAAARGDKGAKLALRMLEKPEWLLSTTLVGTNISIVANTTLITALIMERLGESYSWVAVAVAAPVIWILGEIVPKSLFQERADVITPKAVYVLRVASQVFSPILIVFAGLARMMPTLFGGPERKNPFTLREAIATMMDMSSSHDDILPVEKDMIRRIFGFNETTAREIMVPLIDVVGIAKNANCGEAVERALEAAHKRLPVYDGRIDNIVGMLNVLDLLTVDPDRPISDFVRSVQFSPAGKSIGELLVAMRRDGGQTTVVVDEYGGAEGIVMLEDVLEEVVGELEDEYDDEESQELAPQKLDEKDYLVNGRYGDAEFPDGDYETVAGLVLAIANEVPAAGTSIEWKDLTFTVTDSNEQAILALRVRW